MTYGSSPVASQGVAHSVQVKAQSSIVYLVLKTVLAIMNSIMVRVREGRAKVKFLIIPTSIPWIRPKVKRLDCFASPLIALIAELSLRQRKGPAFTRGL